VGPFAEVTAVVALAVVGVTVGQARADGSSTTVLTMRLSGPDVGGRTVVVRAVDNTGAGGAEQASLVLGTGRTSGSGTAALAAEPDAVAAFADDTGWVNFESQVLVAGEPRFTSFSRRWTGTQWVDPDGRPAAVPMAMSTTPSEQPPEQDAGAPPAPAMTDVTVAARAPRGEVDCAWYDDSAANAQTTIGEFHTGANTKGNFTYGTSSDSDISVGYNYGRGWSVGGTGHVGNSRSTYIRFNAGSSFHHQLRSTFRFVHWHLTLGPSCAGSSRWGQRYQKVTPASWQSGSEVGPVVKGSFCQSAAGRRSFALNSDFYRGSKRAYTYGGAAKAWGASLNATSGFSKFVDMNYHFGGNKKVTHYLCGRPDILSSKIIYAR
jgi:hypothetical protein